MKISIFIVLFLAVTFLSQVPPASAWAAPNHYAIAEEVYNSLPADEQSKLSLSEMINGADDPDFRFFDFKYHHCPGGQEKADYWLNKGHEYYVNGEYEQASYCFGVASHYLSDSVCPPHCSEDSGYQHTSYELQAILYQPHITFYEGSVDSTLNRDSQLAEKAWDEWLKNSDDVYIQDYLNKAADLSYMAINGAVA